MIGLVPYFAELPSRIDGKNVQIRRFKHVARVIGMCVQLISVAKLLNLVQYRVYCIIKGNVLYILSRKSKHLPYFWILVRQPSIDLPRITSHLAFYLSFKLFSLLITSTYHFITFFFFECGEFPVVVIISTFLQQRRRQKKQKPVSASSLVSGALCTTR